MTIQLLDELVPATTEGYVVDVQYVRGGAITGATGATGAAGPAGPAGAVGATGPVGPVATGALPSGYLEKSTPSGTTSATLQDVPLGASGSPYLSLDLTLTVAQYVCLDVSFELQTQSGAAASTMGVALVYDTTTEAEYQRYLSGTNDLGIGAITARTALLQPGVHTFKLQFRRVSGVATPGINKADLRAVGTALQ